MSTAAKPELLAEPARVIPLPTPQPPIAKRRQLRKWVVLITLIVLSAAGAAMWRLHAQNIVTFETMSMERGSIESNITATGNLNPVVNVQVGSQVSGNIKELYADFNTKVTKGQLVALIDPQMFQAQVDQATSAAESAVFNTVTAAAQLEKSSADLAGAKAAKENLEAVFAKDRANALNAGIQWRRTEKLFKAGVVSQQDYDTARAAFEASQAQLTSDN